MFKTKMGALWTVALIVFVMVNLVHLWQGFRDGSRQGEMSSSNIYDRHFSDALNLSDNQIEFSFYTTPAIPQELGRFKLVQIEYKEKFDILHPDELMRGIQTVHCGDEYIKRKVDYWNDRSGASGYGDFEAIYSEARCVGDKSLYIRGDSDSKFFASVAVIFEGCNSYEGYDNCDKLEEWLLGNIFDLWVEFDFKQLDMGLDNENQMYTTTKAIANSQTFSDIELGHNQYTNINDWIGFFLKDPEPDSFLSVDKHTHTPFDNTYGYGA